jgi:hypothetical protein
MSTLRSSIGALAVAGLALAGLACENTAQGIKKDTQENTAKAKEEARQAEAKTSDERAEAKETAGEVAGGVKDAVKDAGAVLDAGKQTIDVKAALMADASIDASNIDVDTDEKTKTVHLKGSVPTSAQKTAAERVAKTKADGYAVHNMLTVARKTS